MAPKRGIPSKVRKEILEKSSYKCAVCGIKNVPLDIHHILPSREIRSFDPENLIVLCPNCHRTMHAFSPNEREFTNYLVSLLQDHKAFRNIQLGGHITRESVLIADIVLERKSARGWKKVFIECKNWSFTSTNRLKEAIMNFQMYNKAAGEYQFILAFPGRILESDKPVLAAERIEVWDIEYIARTFKAQIAKSDHPYFKPLFLSGLPRKTDTTEQHLLAELRSCKAGKANWPVFQRLSGQILDQLFCPPLQNPIPESSDKAGINRRDWIIPNYSSEGFWRFMREMYHADYIVVDAKNYKGKVKKKEALQIANYLKPHGAGLFGLIICRNGADNGCNLTLRELWMAQRKLIIVLTDRDIEAMLLSASSGGNAENVIGQAIQEFRLSM